MNMDMGTVQSTSVTTPLSWYMWVAQMIVTCLFATGFIVYYQKAWHAAYEKYATRPAMGITIRLGMLVGAIVLGMGMHMIGWMVFTNATGLMFHNLGLFALTMPLLDEGSSIYEYVVRLLGVIEVWLMHHQGYYDQPKFYVSLVLLAIAVVILRVYQDKIRYSIWPHILIYSSVGIVFWTTLPTYSAGLHMTPTIALQALVMYIGMTVVTAYMIHSDHHERVVNELNAQEAHFDTLTNTKSYTTYRHDVTTKFTEAKADGTPLAMAMIDIDHFKQINDYYGHLAGDDILAGVAATLATVLRRYPGDQQLYRTGGEEFNIVLSDMTANEAKDMMIACLQAVSSRHFRTINQEAVATISIGVADMQATDATVDDLYARADMNLYQSKHNGRNTITIMGETLDVTKEARVFASTTLFTQHVMDAKVQPPVLTNNEVLVAHYEYGADRWHFPRYFEVPLQDQLQFVADVMRVSPCSRIMLNLTKAQFENPKTPARLGDFVRTQPNLEYLGVELIDYLDVEKLKVIAPAYQQAGIHLGLEKEEALVAFENFQRLFPYFDTFKFGIDYLRGVYADSGNQEDVLAQWQAGTQKYQIDIIVSDIENQDDADYAIKTLGARYLQGYYFDRPELPRIS